MGNLKDIKINNTSSVFLKPNKEKWICLLVALTNLLGVPLIKTMNQLAIIVAASNKES